MTSFSIQNFGCRTNQAEAFDWSAELRRRGLRRDPSGRGTVVVVNTCTLTSRADRDARKFIRRVVRENPGARVLVTGCLAERDGESLRSMPGVWKVVPNTEKEGIPDAVFAAERPGLPVAESVPAAEPFRSRALVKVQDGCDLACRFCIIPQVRGRSRSVAPTRVLGRIRELVEAGFAEVVLTGIHLSSYGRDPRSTLADLLGAIDGLPGNFRVRLSSLDPRLLPSPLVEALIRSPRISPHFHLSLQHGADRVLRAMGRESTAAEYRALAAALSGRSDETAIGADLIVGFPGETEDDFEATRELVRDAPLSYIHVFSFSPRPGTAAAQDVQVDEPAKSRRASRLRLLGGQKNLAFRRRFLGRELDGIVVRSSKAGGEVLTSNYIDVAVPPGPARLGAAVRVRIDRVADGKTTGEIVGLMSPGLSG